MNVAQLADQLRRDNHFMKDVTRWEVIPARPAKTAPFPDSLRTCRTGHPQPVYPPGPKPGGYRPGRGCDRGHAHCLRQNHVL